MAIYVKLEDNLISKYPYMIGDLIKDNPGISFPTTNISLETLAEYNVYPVKPTSMPIPTEKDFIVKESIPIKINGEFIQTWDIVQGTDQQVEQKLNQVESDFITLVQNRLDTFARTRGYDGILEACSYATSKTPTYAAEGAYCIEARDNTWNNFYSVVEAMKVGALPWLPRFSQIEALLPPLEWPN